MIQFSHDTFYQGVASKISHLIPLTHINRFAIIILGHSDDYYYLVGGSWDIPPAIPGGDHITNISFKFVSSERALIIVDIRLFSQAPTPNYHVVVGEIDLKNTEHLNAFEKKRLDGKLISDATKVVT